MRRIAWLAVLAFSLLAAPSVARAASYSTTVTYSGGGCAICGGGAGAYQCSPGAKSFTDQTPGGSKVTAVQVDLYYLQCGSTSIDVRFNGTSVQGYKTAAGGCSCNTCAPVLVFSASTPNGFPGWVVGGSNSFSLAWTGTSGPCVQRAVITVTYTAGAQIAVTPNPNNFGSQRVNTTSAPTTFTIKNAGGGTLTIGSTSLNGPFAVSGLTTPLNIGAGGSTTFTATFKPTMTGPGAGTLTLNNNSGTPAYVVNLSGTGIASKLTFDPGSLDFGAVQAPGTSPARTVTIRNDGTAQLNISKSTLTGPFTTTNLAPPLALDPGKTTTFQVQFKPTMAGSFNGKVELNSDDPAQPNVLPLAGVGTSPGIAAAPNPVQFGTAAINATTPANVVISNTGTGDLKVSGLSIAGANAADFGIKTAPGLPATIVKNSSIQVTLEFKPKDHGVRMANLVVASDAQNAPMLTVGLVGTGAGPAISATPNPLDVGSANVGDTVTGQLVVKNTGETNLSIMNLTFSTMEFAAMGANFPIPVTPGNTATLTVAFNPSMVGARAGKVTITSNDPLKPTTDVDLKGLGTSPMLAVSPMMIDFGGVLINSASGPQVVKVENKGSGPLTIKTAMVSGKDAGLYLLQGVMLPLVIPPMGQSTLSLTFNPTMVGTFGDAKLVLTSDDPKAMTVEVPLTGNGTAPMIAVLPAMIDFGSQLVNRTSGKRAVEISNAGSAVLSVLTIQVSGPQAAAFALVNPPMTPLLLQPMEMKSVELTLTPPMIGQAVATLVVQSDDPMSPQAKVSLKGMGVSTALSVSPATIDFGTVKAPGMAGPKQIEVTNSSGDPITLVDATVGGANPMAFTASAAAGAVDPGMTKKIDVTFKGDMAGEYTAVVTVKANDVMIPPATVMLSGRAVSMLVDVTPPSLDFGEVEVGMKSATKMVTVTNRGSAPAQIMSATSDDAVFAVSDVKMDPIPPGMTSTFSVAFAPTAAGTKTAKIGVTLSGGMMPEAFVMASGTGKVAAMPDLAMGAVDAGQPMPMGGCKCAVGTRGPAGRAPWLALGLLAIGLGLLRRRR